MNGAIAEPSVAISSARNNAIVIIIGASQFLANAQEGPELDHEAAHQIPLELSSLRLFRPSGPKAGSLKDAQSIW